jgi:hypothetical protein
MSVYDGPTLAALLVDLSVARSLYMALSFGSGVANRWGLR